MGVKGLNNLLRSRAVFDSERMSLHDWSPGQEIYVDLLSCFYWRILKSLRSENFAENIANWLSVYFSRVRGRIVFVIDGRRSHQKHLRMRDK